MDQKEGIPEVDETLAHAEMAAAVEAATEATDAVPGSPVTDPTGVTPEVVAAPEEWDFPPASAGRRGVEDTAADAADEAKAEEDAADTAADAAEDAADTAAEAAEDAADTAGDAAEDAGDAAEDAAADAIDERTSVDDDHVDVLQTGPVTISATSVSVAQSGVSRINAREVSVTQSGVALVRTDLLRLESESNAALVVSRRAHLAAESRVLVLISRQTSGDARPLLDWRSALAAVLGYLVFRRIVGRLIRR